MLYLHDIKIVLLEYFIYVDDFLNINTELETTAIFKFKIALFILTLIVFKYHLKISVLSILSQLEVHMVSICLTLYCCS